MKIKDDYCQNVPRVRICTDPEDRHVELWMMCKNEDGTCYPIEIQMSPEGTYNLARTLNNAYFELKKLELEEFRLKLKEGLEDF